MIEGYKELNKNISETINIIEDVSAASKEQMLGIEQINQAVNMLPELFPFAYHTVASFR